eukprot:CAMPEP_0201877736 /NCGR_PEP_ID=MMETSP0902-20130614/9082_1 /ASSEMBLY_ACC=CAM_ASM_000551 /TAXON_ID=420261 /ORGANISM="Thalassiosira antarctica, Strain CCMP982" /LENGTH=378 /DNA_ID=CAMNT_0048405247 /DNA_START=122 /DNA_END=1255 /DNA_ORIENTATION=+
MMATTTRRSSARLQKRSLSSSNVVNDPPLSEQYSSMKVLDLRDLLRQRGLAVSGVKSILIERLTSSATDSPTTTTDNDATKGAVSKPQPKSKRARKKSSLESIPKSTSNTKTSSQTPSSSVVDCLPRTRELQLQSSHEDSMTNLLAIIGVDEAGRGPLAGPVVCAAAIVPTNIAGIIDSKKITKEEERERIYEELIASPDIRYAVAVVNAQRIDEINILQATLEGMRMAVEGVMSIDGGNQDEKGKNVASAERKELSYVITGGGTANNTNDTKSKLSNNSYYALIDGNKTPKEMPCPCESMVKGDGREYSIGAASILAKVTRDRLMHEYDKKYPEFNLRQHKGYGTAAHMSAVREFGASPIHRRTFAPLKHMEIDEEG